MSDSTLLVLSILAIAICLMMTMTVIHVDIDDLIKVLEQTNTILLSLKK